jgi:hypothetical protein
MTGHCEMPLSRRELKRRCAHASDFNRRRRQLAMVARATPPWVHPIRR